MNEYMAMLREEQRSEREWARDHDPRYWDEVDRQREEAARHAWDEDHR